MKGNVKLEIIRDGKIIGTHITHNDVTNEGKNALLDIMFHADTQIDPWYIGLIDNASYTGVASTDTMASHAGWIENEDFSSPLTRGEWDEDAASGQSITNSTTVDFTMDASVTIRGIFITSDSTLGGTTGTLWATALFASTISLNSGDVLKITYTVSC